jgi:hypothetical protein
MLILTLEPKASTPLPAGRFRFLTGQIYWLSGLFLNDAPLNAGRNRTIDNG